MVWGKGVIALEDRPSELQRPEVVGVFAGGCVERGVGSSFRHSAHAHNVQGHPHYGWICFRAWKSPPDRELVLHELAHILVPNEGHTAAYRECLKYLGGNVTPYCYGWKERQEQEMLLKKQARFRWLAKQWFLYESPVREGA